MDEKKIGALLVHCPESNNPQDLTGILTERDIIELLSRSDENLDNFKVDNFIDLEIIHKDGSKDIIICKHTYNVSQIEWFKAGSALNLIRSKQIS